MGFLLIHGAWHGAWCWAPVLEVFERQGVEALAIDLPGHGSRRTSDSPVQLADYAAAVVEAAGTMSAPPRLVGHSMGGMAISAAAELDPEAFESLIYLAAFLPSSGQALIDLTAELGGGQGRMEGQTIVLDRDEARGLFYQDCSPERADWALDHIQPQPIGPALDPVALSADRWGRLAWDYVVCAKDQAIRPDFQRLMARRAGREQVFTLDRGHSPFLADPSELCAALLDLRQSRAA